MAAGPCYTAMGGMGGVCPAMGSTMGAAMGSTAGGAMGFMMGAGMGADMQSGMVAGASNGCGTSGGVPAGMHATAMGPCMGAGMRSTQGCAGVGMHAGTGAGPQTGMLGGMAPQFGGLMQASATHGAPAAVPSVAGLPLGFASASSASSARSPGADAFSFLGGLGGVSGGLHAGALQRTAPPTPPSQHASAPTDSFGTIDAFSAFGAQKTPAPQALEAVRGAAAAEAAAAAAAAEQRIREDGPPTPTLDRCCLWCVLVWLLLLGYVLLVTILVHVQAGTVVVLLVLVVQVERRLRAIGVGYNIMGRKAGDSGVDAAPAAKQGRLKDQVEKQSSGSREQIRYLRVKACWCDRKSQQKATSLKLQLMMSPTARSSCVKDMNTQESSIPLHQAVRAAIRSQAGEYRAGGASRGALEREAERLMRKLGLQDGRSQKEKGLDRVVPQVGSSAFPFAVPPSAREGTFLPAVLAGRRRVRSLEPGSELVHRVSGTHEHRSARSRGEDLSNISCLANEARGPTGTESLEALRDLVESLESVSARVAALEASPHHGAGPPYRGSPVSPAGSQLAISLLSERLDTLEAEVPAAHGRLGESLLALWSAVREISSELASCGVGGDHADRSEDKHLLRGFMPAGRCALRTSVNYKNQYALGQWSRDDGPRVRCLCLEGKKSAGTPWQRVERGLCKGQGEEELKKHLKCSRCGQEKLMVEFAKTGRNAEERKCKTQEEERQRTEEAKKAACSKCGESKSKGTFSARMLRNATDAPIARAKCVDAAAAQRGMAAGKGARACVVCEVAQRRGCFSKWEGAADRGRERKRCVDAAAARRDMAARKDARGCVVRGVAQRRERVAERAREGVADRDRRRKRFVDAAAARRDMAAREDVRGCVVCGVARRLDCFSEWMWEGVADRDRERKRCVDAGAGRRDVAARKGARGCVVRGAAQRRDFFL
ncbi:unnamed protein product [Prorocentrum cordatum]|uniref:Uncharacterized protein n=1 Tax=Prorocentrum cordatum TaxID=2364126 RepID=A0ABN9V5U2_9DINO|nr:unnamed protein product [Polarella glacialis]